MKEKFNENGFSLIELVITVGILLIFATIGVLSYQGFMKNSYEAAANDAVSQVYTSAIIYQNDGKDPKKAGIEYNSSVGKDSNGEPIIETTVEELSNGGLRVIATYSGTDVQAVKESTSKSGDDIEDEEEIVIPPAPLKDTISSLTYMCDVNTIAAVPIFNASSDTKVHIISDTDEKAITNLSQQFEMKAGVTYKLVVDGTFNTLGKNSYNNYFEKCLISIDTLGKDSGITEINYLGKEKFVSVPNNIPSTVTSLNSAFSQASSFNDPSVSNWDVSNVKDMSRMFYIASTFNQDISSWDVSSVTNMDEMFRNSTNFNNGNAALNWGNTTANVKSMKNMFDNTGLFNQDISSWDVSSVIDMSNMFNGAKAFDNGGIALDWRDTSNVTNMSGMFKTSEQFNQDISSWDVSSVIDMSSMFQLSKKFNKPLNTWDVSNVKNMVWMFGGTKAFNQNISMWNVSSDVKSGGFNGSYSSLKNENIPESFRV